MNIVYMMGVVLGVLGGLVILMGVQAGLLVWRSWRRDRALRAPVEPRQQWEVPCCPPPSGCGSTELVLHGTRGYRCMACGLMFSRDRAGRRTP